MNKTSANFNNTAQTLFLGTRQKFLEQNIKGIMGSTWDATHMTSFLSKSFYSNKKSPQKLEYCQNPQQRTFSNHKSNEKINRKSQDYFFKNLRHDKNSSHIGYTKVNPLVSNIDVSKPRQQALVNYFKNKAEKLQKYQDINLSKTPSLYNEDNSKFKFESNSVKFRLTDPLTSRYEPEQRQKLGYSLQRMKRQITKRHPHGLTGLDHSEAKEPYFYTTSPAKKSIRFYDSQSQNFDLTRDWNSKKRVAPVQEEQRIRAMQSIRKSRNENIHGYNIINNRIDK